MAKGKMRLIRENIADVLKAVTEQSAPKIYEAIQSEVGYRTVERMILEMMNDEGLTASGCIYYVNEAL
jgi:hypothetical protein